MGKDKGKGGGIGGGNPNHGTQEVSILKILMLDLYTLYKRENLNNFTI